MTRTFISVAATCFKLIATILVDDVVIASCLRKLITLMLSLINQAARFKIGNGDELSLGSAVMQNPDTEAVTLVDIIVFRNLNDAMDNLALWAHELKHVEQYQQWGVREFAVRYSRDFNTVEGPAYEMQRRVASALRAQNSATGDTANR